ncbi:MAG: hypothetical protein LBC85_03785 [Fibromonadaceae bacterium]|jgi:uncharacterized protein (TIGR02145 family)|nr:hypothetical protein [Fibromonadaceae bacterium]
MKKVSSVLVVASFAFALVFIFSCGELGSGDDGNPAISSSSGYVPPIVSSSSEYYDDPTGCLYDRIEYNPLEYSCCAPPLPSNLGQELPNCCNSDKIFSLANQSCRAFVIFTQCGTGEHHNPTTQFCIGNDVLQLCGGKEYNPEDQRCQNNIVETKCGMDGWYNSVTQFCIGNNVLDKCGGTIYLDGKFVFVGEEYNPENQRCRNRIIETQCEDDRWYNSATHFCHTDNKVYYKCGTYNPETHYCKNGTTPTQYGYITYGDQTYKTIIIGSQTWMAENLNYNGACYGNSESNCDIYGGLYRWETAINVCPSGWHLPSDEEWNILAKFVDPAWTSYVLGNVAGTRLKSASGWNDSNGKSGNGMDEFGFTALPGGRRVGNSYEYVGYYGYWWSATEITASSRVYFHTMGYYNEYVSRSNGGSGDLFSVRCIQN